MTWQQIAALTRLTCRECLASARLRLAPTTSSAVSWTVLQCLRTIGITGLERAKRAVWTRIGHVRDQLTRLRACGNGATPLWGILPASTIYNTPDKFLSKIMLVRYQLRIEINPYLLTHAYTYRHIPLVVWYKYVLLLETLYQL